MRPTPLYLWFLIIIFISPIANSQTTFHREINILGWTPDGENILFFEKTFFNDQPNARAVLFEIKRNKVIHEFILQMPKDSPDTLLKRKKSLKEFIENKNIRPTTSPALFSAHQIQGYLTPNGQHVLRTELNYRPVSKKKGLQALEITYFLFDLKSQKESEIAQMTLESLDGERPLARNAIGSVKLIETNWSPKAEHLAVILEEKRPNYLLQGLVTLTLENLPLSLANPKPFDKPIAPHTLAPQKPKKPLPVAKAPPKPLTPQFQIKDKQKPEMEEDEPFFQEMLRHFSKPLQGEAPLLNWSPWAKASKGKQFSALFHSYLVCPSFLNYEEEREVRLFENQMDPRVSIYHEPSESLWETAINPFLNPSGIDLRWQGDQLEVLFANGVFKTLSPEMRSFRKISKGQKSFTLELKNYSKQKKAVKAVKKLCQKGYPAFYVKFLEDPKQKTWYRLRVGKFMTEKDAEHYIYQNDWIRKKYSNYLVTRF